MTTYDPKTTALLLIDPYNDFLSAGGKLWPRAKPIADEVGLLDNLSTIMRAAREAGLGIFFVPHRRWEPGQYDGWKNLTPYQQAETRTKSSRKTLEAVASTTISSSSRAMSWSRNIGLRVVSRTPTWTIC
jgi:nicotinamidase-related amidase